MGLPGGRMWSEERVGLCSAALPHLQGSWRKSVWQRVKRRVRVGEGNWNVWYFQSQREEGFQNSEWSTWWDDSKRLCDMRTIKSTLKGTWLVQPVERATLDLGVLSSSPTLGVEIT